MVQSKAVNLQDTFLNNVRKSGVLVTVHVTNGFQIKNVRVLGYDNFVVILESEQKQMMIYKHAISSITPEKSVAFYNKGEEHAD